jgi:hypothetical protein
MSAKILFVDGDANILAGFQRQPKKAFSVETGLADSRERTGMTTMPFNACRIRSDCFHHPGVFEENDSTLIPKIS